MRPEVKFYIMKPYVVCILKQDGKTYFGAARRNSRDKWKPTVGMRLACIRAIIDEAQTQEEEITGRNPLERSGVTDMAEIEAYAERLTGGRVVAP